MMISLFYTTVIIFIIYNISVILKFGVPVSISESYYLISKELKCNNHPWFWLFTVLIAFPVMMIGTILSSDTFPEAFSIFFCGGTLIAVGTASNFKEDFVKKYHNGFAGVCAFLSLVWVFTVVPELWFIPLILGVIAVPLGLYIKGHKTTETNRNSLVYFLELACFLQLFICMFIRLIQYNNLTI